MTAVGPCLTRLGTDCIDLYRGHRNDQAAPLARGRLARPWQQAKTTSRSDNDGFADLPDTPRHDFQGVSDDDELQAITARLPGSAPTGA